MEAKRRRGRPIGSGKKDDGLLKGVAEMLARNPSLSVRAAILKMISATNGNGVYDQALLRRLQKKWERVGDRFLADAQERARPKPAMRSTTIPEMVVARGADVNNVIAFAAASPTMAAAQHYLKEIDPFRYLSTEQKERMFGFEKLDAAKISAFDQLAVAVATGKFLNSPAMKILEQFARSPEADRLAKFAFSPRDSG